MGLIYTGKKEKQIYTAYGITVYGVQNKYDWTIYPDRPMENVYSSLRIEKDGNSIVNIQLGNKCIFESNFDRTIDNFLWWIDRDKPDSYDIEKAVFKSLCQTDSLFNYLIGNRKQKEKAHINQVEKIEKIHKEKQKQIELIERYYRKENLVAKLYCEQIYIVKPYNEKAKQLIENSNEKQFGKLMDFMNKYPENKDAIIIICGDVEEIVNKIGE